MLKDFTDRGTYRGTRGARGTRAARGARYARGTRGARGTRAARGVRYVHGVPYTREVTFAHKARQYQMAQTTLPAGGQCGELVASVVSKSQQAKVAGRVLGAAVIGGLALWFAKKSSLKKDAQWMIPLGAAAAGAFFGPAMPGIKDGAALVVGLPAAREARADCLLEQSAQ